MGNHDAFFIKADKLKKLKKEQAKEPVRAI
jgi:hypothetical protein